MSILRQALRAAASSLEALPESSGWQRRYVFDAGSAVFAGHFPEHPVLPGVVQVLMAQMTLEDALGGPLSLSAIVQAKFTAPVEPGAVIELRVQQGRSAGLWECALHCAGRLASRFLIETGPENA
ncbi:MAG: hypothetical protein LBC79_03085 [Deltaproteobacteria bacterium]|jgi:3-hydroxyacyl-[acyl-carrier-protein] dehydratase|nr:hypothetical protein [Deltaproteobacteria bacterium]